MKWKGTLVLGAAALAAVLGCSKEAQLYLGGPPGAEARQALSNSSVVMMIGGSAAIGARAEDAVGNVTGAAVAIASCNSSIATVTAGSADETWTSTATINGVAMGVTCLTASSGGFSDSIGVTVGPAGVAIVGPDTVLSGTLGQYSTTYVDGSGADITGTVPLTWSSSNTARLVVGETTGEAQGQSPGSVLVQAYAPGGANSNKSVLVIPGVFAGTLSSPSGTPGELITVTRAAGAPPFDEDVAVKVGAASGWVELVEPFQGRSNKIQFSVPATGSTAAQTLAFTNLGPGQVAQNGSFTPSQATQDIYSPGNVDDYTGAVDWDAAKSPEGHIYLVDATGSDHFFKVSAGASPRTVTVTVDWDDGSDVDILWTDEGYNAYVGNFDGASSAKPEVSTVTIPANTTWLLIIEMYSAADSFTNIRITLQ